MRELQEVLDHIFSQTVSRIILSNPENNQGYQKIAVRRIQIKGELQYQFEKYTRTQVFHENLTAEEAKKSLLHCLQTQFRQMEALTDVQTHLWKRSKKGKQLYHEKTRERPYQETNLAHNREKQYLLREGNVIPPLVDLGIFTPEGKIVQSKYDKFKQINRFVEMVNDSIPENRKTLTVVDFGCGKSYLTFILYYFLTEVRGIEARITGLDRRRDVIEHCQRIAEKYGYHGLHFEIGDIAGYKTEEHVNMVISLHACDTATDYAIWNAIAWKADMIFSVPCCQHEVNQQLRGGSSAITRYGLLKERFAALMTDSIRGCLLESQGYHVQLLEFIDMAHSPKNVLIRGIRGTVSDGKRREALRQAEAAIDEYRVSPALYRLLMESKERDGWNNGT